MFTKQQLAAWREQGFEFDGFYDSVAVEEKKEANKTLSIKFKSHKIDKEKHILVFEVTTPVLKNISATIYVEEVDSLRNDPVLTSKQNIKSNDTTIVTTSFNKNLNFTEFLFDDGNTFKATIICDAFSAESAVFKLDKIIEIKKDCQLNEPKIVEEDDRNYSELQKAKLIATIFGESDGDVNLMVNIPWIYFNLTGTLGFEKGMNRSSFYKNPNKNKYIAESYRISMYYLGQGNEYENYEIVNGLKVKDYCLNTNPSFLKTYKYGLDIIKTFFETYIFISKIENPLYNWEGQGYWGDMDIRDSRKKWAMASQYFHLQNKCRVKNLLVKEIIAYNKRGEDVTTYLCDDKGIEIYFKNNPNDLPKYINGDFKSIPRVHLPKNKTLNK